MMMAGMFAQAGDKDHITITGKSIPQGIRCRIDLEDGLLKALFSMSQMGGMMGPGGPGGMPPGMPPGGMPPGGMPPGGQRPPGF
jgi:hypothetical protein